MVAPGPSGNLLEKPSRILFFTGKGGVGKTSSACAVGIALADRGKRVLLVSTDPASNLDEVLGVKLDGQPKPVPGVPGLSALNIDPVRSAREYRERVVGPYRGVLPASAVASIEEQLSGACTVEIAAFDEFSKLLGDPKATSAFDHVIFDTAPTGHTLRLLELPAAWSGFLEANVGGTSCLGPLAGLKAQRELYAESMKALADPTRTTLILVARADRASLAEAERTLRETHNLGIQRHHLILNGVFKAQDKKDAVAVELETREKSVLDSIPENLGQIPRTTLPLLPFGLVGSEALRAMFLPPQPVRVPPNTPGLVDKMTGANLATLIDQIEKPGQGVVMTMGKGGVGKTTVAARVAMELARRGHEVLLTTTDPAAHVEAAAYEHSALLKVERIDPEVETRAYSEEVMKTAGAGLDAQGRALLEEDLRSPCTEEIAVFRAFAKTVAQGEGKFVVIDTAPTGHTLLLLDAAEAYHREVLKKPAGNPKEVQTLLPRLRDPEFTKILLVTLPEATPVHEAKQLEEDLGRAGIVPFAWVINQCFSPLEVSDPVLKARKYNEVKYIGEVSSHSNNPVVIPWGLERQPIPVPGIS